MIADRLRLLVADYAIADLCVCRINPVNPCIAALQHGLLALFSSVCLYGIALLVYGSFSKRVVSVGSFSPFINKTIQTASSLTCALLVAFSLCMLAPVYTDHNLMRGWRKFVQFQFQVIECVEGPAIAERFWNNCASHLTFAAACFGREHDYERALDYYSQYKKLGDKTNIFHYLVDDVLGRVCDLNDFQRQMLRPAFHSEMWSKPGGECYAPELVSTSVSPKQSYIIPPERRLLYQLRFSQTPIVTGDK